MEEFLSPVKIHVHIWPLEFAVVKKRKLNTSGWFLVAVIARDALEFLEMI